MPYLIRITVAVALVAALMVWLLGALPLPLALLLAVIVGWGVIDDVRMGRIHADKLPEIPRWNKKTSKLSCLNCRFWDTDCIRPCRLGWPDPEEGGPSYANECGDYAAKP
jgi:hypothetical protein